MYNIHVGVWNIEMEVVEVLSRGAYRDKEGKGRGGRGRGRGEGEAGR